MQVITAILKAINRKVLSFDLEAIPMLAVGLF